MHQHSARNSCTPRRTSSRPGTRAHPEHQHSARNSCTPRSASSRPGTRAHPDAPALSQALGHIQTRQLSARHSCTPRRTSTQPGTRAHPDAPALSQALVHTQTHQLSARNSCTPRRTSTRPGTRAHPEAPALGQALVHTQTHQHSARNSRTSSRPGTRAHPDAPALGQELVHTQTHQHSARHSCTPRRTSSQPGTRAHPDAPALSQELVHTQTRQLSPKTSSSFTGVFVTPVSDNFLEWIATVQGLKDSLWEGAIFQLFLKYTDKYNSVPPSVIFNTIPFHPNVNKTSGKPCIDFLDNPEEWNNRLTMTSILLTIQVMLSNPVMENPVNVEAAEMLQNNTSHYRKVVFDCVRASQQLNAGMMDNTSSKLTISLAQTESAEHFRKIQTISFEDYHSAWSGIATSKATHPCFKNPTALWNYFNEETDAKAESNVSPTIHKRIRKPAAADVADGKQIGMNEMKPTYQFHNTTDEIIDPHTSVPRVQRMEVSEKHEESWEEEVDHLVAWTNTLSTTALED
ncbi:ubiquitin-conjugating enzyme E2 U-like [Rhinatrema bivittatum]|uniref:ubiquitin-conjugating enzyme E2 U-like n=1 Tax=Rhinatrema bivittatum TaxID=194408 RepID=UPI00112B5157|nr:ubiquitin-conjugating enzyme E2 U-like [Rhinatrema bivittatum]